LLLARFRPVFPRNKNIGVNYFSGQEAFILHIWQKSTKETSIRSINLANEMSDLMSKASNLANEMSDLMSKASNLANEMSDLMSKASK
jgi:hypothetical protein